MLQFHQNDLKHKKHIEITTEINISELDNIIIDNPLIKRINGIEIDLDLDYDEVISMVEVNGIINFNLVAIDALTGIDFEYDDSLDWNDQYYFTTEYDDNLNIIDTNIFNLLIYIGEQININIPIKLVAKNKNNDIIKKVDKDWELLTEDELEQSKQNQLDSRWQQMDQKKK